ncbi:hypothetical protein ACQJBY_064729 [Aegilops geniculata]
MGTRPLTSLSFKRPDSRGAGRGRRPRAGPGQARSRTWSGEPASGTPRVGGRAPPMDETREGRLADGDGPGKADGACDPAGCVLRRPGGAGPRGARDGGGARRPRADAGAGAGGGRREAGPGRVRGGGGGLREQADQRGSKPAREGCGLGSSSSRRWRGVAGRRTGRSREAGKRARPSRRREAGPGPGGVREESNPALRVESAQRRGAGWSGAEEAGVGCTRGGIGADARCGGRLLMTRRNRPAAEPEPLRQPDAASGAVETARGAAEQRAWRGEEDGLGEAARRCVQPSQWLG